MNLEQIREQLLQQITVVQQQPLPLLLAVAGCFLTVLILTVIYIISRRKRKNQRLRRGMSSELSNWDDLKSKISKKNPFFWWKSEKQTEKKKESQPGAIATPSRPRARSRRPKSLEKSSSKSSASLRKLSRKGTTLSDEPTTTPRVTRRRRKSSTVVIESSPPLSSVTRKTSQSPKPKKTLALLARGVSTRSEKLPEALVDRHPW